MSHSRKDTLVRTREWKKHLRPCGKRDQAKRERIAAKREMTKELDAARDKYDYIDFKKRINKYIP